MDLGLKTDTKKKSLVVVFLTLVEGARRIASLFET